MPAHIHAQRLGDVEPIIDVLIQQQLNQLTLEGHGVGITRLPDKFAGGGDVVVGDVHPEGIFTKTDNVLACLTIETNEAVKLIGGLADQFRRDAHGKPH